jgi:hypothetical protein
MSIRRNNIKLNFSPSKENPYGQQVRTKKKTKT